MNKPNQLRQVNKHLSFSENKDRSVYPWTHRDGIYVKGYIYSNNSIITGQDLISYFAGVDNVTSLKSKLEEANGYFAVIIDGFSKMFAAVDRVCSTHLFYRVKEEIEVGDSYKGFLERPCIVNKAAMKSFLASGYVHGEDTLLEDTYQVPAGGILTIDKDNGKEKISQYFSYLPKVDKKSKSEKDFLNDLHATHLHVFERMVSSLNGRQAVVPLSGGYDSRLIIEMLAHFNHRNVLCVTWGPENYWQVKIARDVAHSMGMDWLRVENTSEQWREWYEAGGFDVEMEAAGALATIPYIQDNVLIENMKKQNKIASDAVFISGNTGDFVEGGHAGRIYTNDEVDNLLDAITSLHLRMHKLRVPEDVTSRIKDEILAFKDMYDDINGFDEYWEWRERQSKFVTKCIKPFETNGFEWRMPFWDLEIMEFWRSVPREMKVNRKLFYEYAEKFMNPRLPQANPSISFIRRYTDALTDGRYAFYRSGASMFSGLLSSNKRASGVDLGDFIFHTPTNLTRLPGLFALDVCGRIVEATGRS